ncbi:type II toxin-antitoxin system PemK/MazF family toxin [Desulfovibrio sp. TomC]|uniref:type II toxin-antitoxin system PemK/MazF family toxin n=1 Tax=Desulfovibrio sp. TomC TaxID=1562888 RepID=UPI0005B8826B|nr:type II toxin-antitoxin system PemK/MazF family toxin [Desulfovibrio sp. TomC]
MKRGDLVTVSLSGDYGKPRPALVIQSDLFADHASVTLLPITGFCVEGAPLLRFDVEPDEANGLRKPSQVMIDKTSTVPREKVDGPFGRLDDETMLEITRALSVFFGIA